MRISTSLDQITLLENATLRMMNVVKHTADGAGTQEESGPIDLKVSAETHQKVRALKAAFGAEDSAHVQAHFTGPYLVHTSIAADLVDGNWLIQRLAVASGSLDFLSMPKPSSARHDAKTYNRDIPKLISAAKKIHNPAPQKPLHNLTAIAAMKSRFGF